jgi:outer membrane protein TolC
MRKPGFAVDSSATYTLADLVALAEAHNPETRAAWEQARTKAAELRVAHAQLYPTGEVKGLERLPIIASAEIGLFARGFGER